MSHFDISEAIVGDLWDWQVTLPPTTLFGKLKEVESLFPVPAPEATIEVGSFDAATGNFEGLKTQIFSDDSLGGLFPVGAEYCVVAGQAAFRYSWMSPSQRVDLMTWSLGGSA